MNFSQFFCFSVVLLICSCSERKVERNKLRVAIHPWPGYEFIYLAEEMNFFEHEGLDVKVLELGSIGDARRVFEKKQVDIMPCTNIELLEMRKRGHSTAQIFYMLDFSNGGDVIIAAPGIELVEGLKGKRVAVERNTINVFLLHRALEKVGLGIKDVHVVQMDQTLMESAYEDKQVDAIVTFPPFSSHMEERHAMKTIFSSSAIPNEILDCIVADKAYIEANDDLLVKFVRAHEKALSYANTHPVEAYSIMAKHEGISAHSFSNALVHDLSMISMHDQKKYLQPEGLVSDALKITEDFLLKEGLISGHTTLPYINELVLNRALIAE